MREHFPALVVVVPLIGALVAAILGWVNKRMCFPVAVLAMGGALVAASGMLARVLSGGPFDYNLAGWSPPMGIGYHVDHLNGIVLVVVGAVALLNLVATHRAAAETFGDRLGAFYALYVLFATGLFGIVVTGDAFNLFVLLEITAITGYALIGIGREHAPLASLNYVFMGTIGASLYLLGVGYLYLATGSLNMADLARLLPELYASRMITAAFIICMLGLFVKMALFPLHGWLPNAYTYMPPVVGGLIAPLTTKVMVYVMARIVLSVFTPAFAFGHLAMGPAAVWLAIVAMLAGSLMALSQQRLTRMLSYIIVAEVGYMVGGFWLGNRTAMTGAVLHIVNDAAMTLCVFLAAAGLRFKLKTDDFHALQGAFRKMPVTMGVLVVGALSIIGVPPTCGFFSKWYLISGGIAAGHYPFVAALLLSSLVNAVLFFRIFEIGHFEPFPDDRGAHAGHHVQVTEAPVSMSAVMVLAAIGLIVLGLYAGKIVTTIIDPALPAGIV